MMSKAQDFLIKFDPEGPYHLIAIGGKVGLVFRRFDRVADAGNWGRRMNENGSNLYFAVNPLARQPKKGKANKSDVLASRWLFVDIDPEKGRDLKAARAEIEARLVDELPSGVPVPSLVIDSGGGFWGFWRLREDIPTSQGEALGKALAWKFGADHCFNCDRIARLPGFMNWPDDKKKAAGRVAAPARVVKWCDGVDYSSSDFLGLLLEYQESEPAPKRPAPEPKKYDGPVSSVHSWADLDGLRLPSWLREIIQNGRGQKPKKGDDSRSAWVMDCAQAMLKKGVPDDVAAGVLLCPDFGISESVLEASDPVQYANRQIGRAKSLLYRDEPKKPNNVPADDGDNQKKDDFLMGFDDDSLALQFQRDAIKDSALYVASWGCWMLWRGGIWQPDESLKIVSAARRFQREKLAPKAKKPAQKSRLLSSKITMMLEKMARSNPGAAERADVWNVNRWLLGTPNGTVDLRTGRLKRPDKKDRITLKTSVVPSESSECPIWRRSMARWFRQTPEVLPFLQRLAGYALTGSTREHKLFFLFGTGRNGKSVFLNTLTEIMADYSKVSPSATFLASGVDQHPTDLALLQGARLVMANEVPAGKSWNEARIKSLTGGDPITARKMRQDFFTFDPQLTLIIAGNHQPSFGSIDEAISARVVMVHFKETIPDQERDPALMQKLRAEHPAILRWMIEGAIEWQRVGLQVPESVTEDSEGYLDSQDEFGEFIEDCMAEVAMSSTKAADIYKAYSAWAKERGYLRPWTHRGMVRAMRERGFVFKRKNTGQHVEGWVLQAHALPNNLDGMTYADLSRGS